MRACLVAIFSALMVSTSFANEAFVTQITGLRFDAGAASAHDGAGAVFPRRVALPLAPRAVKSVATETSGPMNASYLRQIGTNNATMVSQTGGYNLSVVMQTGSGNHAVVMQRR